MTSEELSELASEFETQGLDYRLDREGTRILVPQQQATKAQATARQVREPASVGSDVSAGDPTAAPAQSLLDQVYGRGRTNVRVAVERSNDVTQFERREMGTDPTSRVATTSDSSLEQYQAGAQTPLPSGRVDCAAVQKLDNVTRYCRATERNRYAVSEQQTVGTRAAGAVRRMTVAVAVDQSLQPKANLSDFRATVARTLGLDPSRGDSITVAAVPFSAGVPSKPTNMSEERPWNGHELEIAAAAMLLGITLACAIPLRRRARS